MTLPPFSVAFSYSRLYTEIIITGVVIANPNGAYKTPFFVTLDRVEVHLPITAVLMTFVRSLWHADGKLEGLIKIPYLMVNEVQIFFEKPEKGAESGRNGLTGTTPRATSHGPRAIPCSPFPTPHSPLPAPHSPLPTPRSPLPTPHSPLPACNNPAA